MSNGYTGKSLKSLVGKKPKHRPWKKIILHKSKKGLIGGLKLGGRIGMKGLQIGGRYAKKKIKKSMRKKRKRKSRRKRRRRY